MPGNITQKVVTCTGTIFVDDLYVLQVFLLINGTEHQYIELRTLPLGNSTNVFEILTVNNSVVVQTSQKVPEKYRRLPLFGAGKNVPEVWWKALGRALVIESYLAECSGYNKFTTLCKITPKVTTVRHYRKINRHCMLDTRHSAPCS